MKDAETPGERLKTAFDRTPETMAAALMVDLRRLAGPVLVSEHGRVEGEAVLWGRAREASVEATIAAAFRAAQNEALERAALVHEVILSSMMTHMDAKIAAAAPQDRFQAVLIADHTKELLGEVPVTIRSLKVLPP